MDKTAWLDLVKDWGLALLAMVAIVAVWRWFAPEPPRSGTAPALTAPMTEGGQFDLADQKAGAVVINFWATWCPPCRAEIPEISRYAGENPEVTVVGVSVDEGMALQTLSRRAQQLGIDYPVAHDATGAIAARWGVNVFPTTFVLNANHEIVAVSQGQVDAHRLAAMVAKATP